MIITPLPLPLALRRVDQARREAARDRQHLGMPPVLIWVGIALACAGVVLAAIR